MSHWLLERGVSPNRVRKGVMLVCAAVVLPLPLVLSLNSFWPVAVMIDEPRAGKYYGGEVAAPVFSELVQQALRMKGVQPDMSVKPQIVTNAVEESF